MCRVPISRSKLAREEWNRRCLGYFFLFAPLASEVNNAFLNRAVQSHIQVASELQNCFGRWRATLWPVPSVCWSATNDFQCTHTCHLHCSPVAKGLLRGWWSMTCMVSLIKVKGVCVSPTLLSRPQQSRSCGKTDVRTSRDRDRCNGWSRRASSISALPCSKHSTVFALSAFFVEPWRFPP